MYKVTCKSRGDVALPPSDPGEAHPPAPPFTPERQAAHEKAVQQAHKLEASGDKAGADALLAPFADMPKPGTTYPAAPGPNGRRRGTGRDGWIAEYLNTESADGWELVTMVKGGSRDDAGTPAVPPGGPGPSDEEHDLAAALQSALDAHKAAGEPDTGPEAALVASTRKALDTYRTSQGATHEDAGYRTRMEAFNRGDAGATDPRRAGGGGDAWTFVFRSDKAQPTLRAQSVQADRPSKTPETKTAEKQTNR